MGEQYKHNLSHLMDNGGIDDKLLSQIAENDEQRQQWSRYHLIRDALHDDLPEQLNVSLNVSIADKVSAAIANEPTVLVPQKRTSFIQKVYTNTPWLKQASGFALAASVTAVTIFSAQSLLPPHTVPANTQLAAQEQQNVESLAAKHQAIPHTRLVNQQHLARQQMAEKLRQQRLERINTYLLQHAENSSSRGVNGMFPYARVVSYEE